VDDAGSKLGKQMTPTAQGSQVNQPRPVQGFDGYAQFIEPGRAWTWACQTADTEHEL
jgi:hypothetical protein